MQGILVLICPITIIVKIIYDSFYDPEIRLRPLSDLNIKPYLFEASLDFTNDENVWASLIAVSCSHFYRMGMDQIVVQRYAAARTLQEAQTRDHPLHHPSRDTQEGGGESQGSTLKQQLAAIVNAFDQNSRQDNGSTLSGIDSRNRRRYLKRLRFENSSVTSVQEDRASRRSHRDTQRDCVGVARPAHTESGALSPAWFKSAETMMNSCETPKDAQGAIILPFLCEKTRAMVASRAGSRVLSFMELRELVLLELKMTPGEYKRNFQETCQASGDL
ncbi:hypothetical protein HPB47_013488 [Ixodes persulcatus]|uniref:Uncharacterized protein n=1 Tax=Ixodes persulcatus TaxID=34615 RepID=A0AC60R1P3_IXOPE|nr:hypothetical protein HPB47_013488 [Ixodes persulcatus]